MYGATKTKLMYHAYLSNSQLGEYLTFLQERGLLVFDQENRLYRLTERGLRFLNLYDEMKVISLPQKELPQDLHPIFSSAPL